MQKNQRFTPLPECTLCGNFGASYGGSVERNNNDESVHSLVGT